MYNSQIMVKRIRSIAKEKGIGIVKLHEICGMSRNAISQAEKSPGGMTTKNIYSIAEALDCSVDYLLGRTGTPKPEADETELTQKLTRFSKNILTIFSKYAIIQKNNFIIIGWL